MPNMKSNCIFRRALLGLSVLAVLPFALAQQNGQAGGNGNNPNGGSVVSQSPRKGESARSASNNDPQSQMRKVGSLYITGTVVRDDGNLPPMETYIERVCATGTTKEVYVSPDGSFGFQVGGASSVLPDASDRSSGLSWDPFGNASGSTAVSSSSPWRLNGCVLRASMGGYRSSELTLNVSQTSGTVDAGTIVISPAVRVMGTTVSATNLAAPKSAKRALARAEKSIEKKDVADAEAQLKSALASYPSYADAWYELGVICDRAGRTEEAKNAFSSALKADANYVKPYIELARMAAREPKWQTTADLTSHALELDPIDLPEGYLLNSIANYNLNNLDAAERSAHKLERLDSAHRFPQVHLLLAGILRRKNDSAGEADELRSYLKYAPHAANAPEVLSRLKELTGANPG